MYIIYQSADRMDERQQGNTKIKKVQDQQKGSSEDNRYSFFGFGDLRLHG